MTVSRTCAALAAIALAATLGGCYAHVEPVPAYSVETEPVEYVPADIDAYPHTEYDGHVVFLVHNRWYFRDDDGDWVYYRREPAPLVRNRRYIQEAPPAHRYYRRGPESAPPAHRVR